MRKRMIMWLTLLGLVIAFGCVAKWQEYRFRRALGPYAARYADEARRALSGSPLGLAGHIIAQETTVSLLWLVAGPVMGKITIFTQPRAAEGMDGMHVYEYHLTFEDGEWRRTDSAYCNDRECRVRGAAIIGRLEAE